LLNLLYFDLFCFKPFVEPNLRTLFETCQNVFSFITNGHICIPALSLAKLKTTNIKSDFLPWLEIFFSGLEIKPDVLQYQEFSVLDSKQCQFKIDPATQVFWFGNLSS